MKVYVKTPARLQFGLIDLNGDLGRIFGGLGVGINQPNVVLKAESSKGFAVSGEKPELTTALAKRFFDTYHVQANVHLQVVQTIPEHAGLGSGTQLALAVATALAKISNVNASTQGLAVAMGRCQRTRVGTTIFEQGGFVVDGGKPLANGVPTTDLPPIIFRQPFPKEWRFVVAVPSANKGLSNDEEKTAFKQLTPMPSETVGKVCRLIMMKLLPALAERNICAFGEALTNIQITIGDYFAQVQGGRYSSPAVTQCIKFMQELGAYGVGQSSWGPACYGLFPKEEAKEAKLKVQAFLKNSVGGQVFTAKANNRGAYIKLTK
ncbi:MAG: kinase [Candidatus Bathyarchaeota archaeon]|nr:kinase [Candidatus Bathyarchaeota archaeon]